MKNGVLVALEDRCWRISQWHDGVATAEDVPFDSDPLAACDAVAAALAKTRDGDEAVCLGLPSNMILAAPITCEGLPRGKARRAAMLYRFEEKLPLDIEQLTTGFLPASGDECLGLAVENARARQLIDGLEAKGIQIQSMCATPLLALWGTCRACHDKIDYAVLAWGSRTDVFRIRAERPVTWYTADSESGVAECLRADQLANAGRKDRPDVLIVGAGPQLPVDAIQAFGEVQRRESDLTAMATATAVLTLSGRQAGWVDFRQGTLQAASQWVPLARLLKAAYVAMIAAVLILSASMWIRAARYGQAAQRLIQQQEDLHHALYPGTPPPANIKSRLQSQAKRLSGLSGAYADIPPQPSALETLRSMVSALPPAVRMRLMQARIGPGGIFMEGQTLAHSDAEVIVQSLSRAGFQMEPPRTERLAKEGVSFVASGKLPEARVPQRSTP